MDESYTVSLIGGAEGEMALFALHQADHDCILTCSYRDKVIEGIAADFFEALCRIREQLAEEGLMPICYGASFNVYPSGMARDMGLGLKAYRTTMGQQAKMSDLVSIFEAGPDVIPSSVKSQKQHFDEWINAPRS